MAGVNPYASAPKTGAEAAVEAPKDLHPAALPKVALSLNPNHLASDHIVSDKLYSGFVEHLGRGIYGGIVDNPAAPSPENLLIEQKSKIAGALGWRKDVMDVIGKKGDLEMPMLRWPGGNFVSNYHWQDGIGPIENRPVRTELAWLSTESNKFGTDEFIDYARALGVEPYLCLNMGTGTYEEALAWLEYCNGTGDTYWANLRRKNTGRHEPHNVKLWGLGNEMHGAWQVGALSATDYAKKAYRWAHGLRLVDPSIQLVSCGNQGNSEWDREVLQKLISVVDFHSIHFYSMLGYQHELNATNQGLSYEKNVFGPAAAERGIEICQSLIDLAKIEQAPKGDSSLAARDVKICYDEWNVWDEVKAPGSNGLEQFYDFTDMLGVAGWLNILVRKSYDVGIACIAQSVNVISPLMTSPDGLLFQTTYFPLKMFSRYMKDGHVLSLPSVSPAYKGPTYPLWVQHLAAPAYVDTVAVAKDLGAGKKSVRLSVINRHPSAAWEGGFAFSDFEVETVEIHEMYSDNLTAKNTFENPTVCTPTVHKFSAKEWEQKAGSWAVRQHSWQFLIFDGKAL